MEREFDNRLFDFWQIDNHYYTAKPIRGEVFDDEGIVEDKK